MNMKIPQKDILELLEQGRKSRIIFAYRSHEFLKSKSKDIDTGYFVKYLAEEALKNNQI